MLLLVLILLIFSLIFSANGCKLENRIHVSDLVSGSNVMRSDLPGCAEACGDNCAGVSFERATKFCGMFSNLNMNKLYAAEGIQVWVKDCASRNLELPGGFCLIFIFMIVMISILMYHFKNAIMKVYCGARIKLLVP